MLALAWSGGKDSALALHALRTAGREPAALLTTARDGFACTDILPAATAAA